MLTAPYVHSSYNNSNNSQNKHHHQQQHQQQQRKIVTNDNSNSDQVMTIDYTNLYIKNLDPEVTSSDLFNRFQIFGKIISARVMKDNVTGKSKGYGFVSFSNTEESNEAQSQMNGQLINSKNIVVTFHEHKKAVKKQQQQDLFNLNSSSSPTTIACYPSSQSISYNGFIPDQRQQQQQQMVASHKQTSYINNNNNNSNNNPWNESRIWMHQQQLQQTKKQHMPMQPSPVAPQSQVPMNPSSYSYNSNSHHHHSNSMVMHHNNISAVAVAAVPSSSASFVSQSQQQQQNNNNNNNSLSNQIQYQKLREAISLQLHDYQQKDLNDLVDLIQSLKKRDLSLCLFNPIFLKQKIEEAYEAIRLFQSPSSGVTTPSLIHQQQQQQTSSSSNTSESNDTTNHVVATILNSSMSENQKKRSFGDILFPYVRATQIKHSPKVTIRLLDSVPLEELAYCMYDKKELTRKAQIAYQDLYAA